MANILAIRRAALIENLLDPISDRDLLSGGYVKSDRRRSYHFEPLAAEPKKHIISHDDYEDTIVEFISSPMKGGSQGNIWIIRGPTGTGKTTTLRYAFLNAHRCAKCMPDGTCDREPFCLWFNLLGALPKAHVKKTGPYEDDLNDDLKSKTSEALWLEIESVLLDKLESVGAIPPEEELVLFWPWLRTNISLVRRDLLRRNLLAHEHIIKSAQTNLDKIGEVRTKIFQEGGVQDRCLYYALVLRYIRRNHVGHCNLVVLDNVDGFEPVAQEEAFQFACELHLLLDAKVIIPMRPYTVSLNIWATQHMEVIEHAAPPAEEAYGKRLERLRDQDSALSTHMEQLVARYQTNRFLSAMVHGTCGISLRFYERNLYNAALSPLVRAEATGANNIRDLHSFDLYQAYFCSELADQLLYKPIFQNLYCLCIHDGKKWSSLKLRILHRLWRSPNKCMQLDNLDKDLLGFSFNSTEIVSALNDLLNKKAPLIWSDSAHRYGPGDLDPNRPARTDGIYLAPLGRGYYEQVFHDPLYIRECIYDYMGMRRPEAIAQWVGICYERLKELGRADEGETRAYINRYGMFYYECLFDRHTSMTRLLWNSIFRKLKELAPGRLREEMRQDEYYPDFIEHRIFDGPGT